MLRSIFLGLLLVTSLASAEIAVFAGGRYNMGDNSAYSPLSSYSSAGTTTGEVGILFGHSTPILGPFIRYGLAYATRNYSVNVISNPSTPGTVGYTVSSIEIPLAVGLSLGMFEIYGQIDGAVKVASSSSATGSWTWSTTETFSDNTFFAAPRGGIGISFIKILRLDAFYEGLTQVSTAQNATTGATAIPIRGTAAGLDVTLYW